MKKVLTMMVMVAVMVTMAGCINQTTTPAPTLEPEGTETILKEDIIEEEVIVEETEKEPNGDWVEHVEVERRDNGTAWFTVVKRDGTKVCTNDAEELCTYIENHTSDNVISVTIESISGDMIISYYDRFAMFVTIGCDCSIYPEEYLD